MSSVFSWKGIQIGQRLEGYRLFSRKNTDMAYYRPRKSPENAPDMPPFPGPGDVWDTMMAPLAGLWQGLGGKNLNYDQWIREKARKRRGQTPGSYRGRGPVNWLGRTITGK